MDQHNGARTQKNDWVAMAIPSARKGLRGLNKIMQLIPPLNLAYPMTYKRPLGLADSLHYGALRFEEQSILQLTKRNQPKMFRSILRNDALYKDPNVRNAVEAMSKLSNVNGCTFEVKCTEDENHETSVSCPKKRSQTIVIRIGKNAPQATKAALLMAYEATCAILPPSELDLGNWVKGDERSDALKNAMRDFAIEIGENGSYNIIPKVQAIKPKQGAASNGEGRFTEGAVPRVNVPPFPVQGPLR